jgi:UDP-N-acetylmuramoyl-tripeptide--D-alanyl-D-alanine ligase
MTDISAAPAALFTAGEVAAIVGASSIGNLDALVTNVVVDSRKAGPGSLFVALPGERADGHDFIASALRNGASCVMACAASKEKALADFRRAVSGSERLSSSLILVESTLASLQALATDYRKRMKSLLRIGVTGSSGKTTTKECIGAALGGVYPEGSLALSEGNLNSDIGLALCMFSLKPEHRVAIFEMGMNRVGEMDELVAMFSPDLAVVTNIGTAHIGLIGSREGIAAQKKRIFSLFSGSQKGFVWEDDPYKSFLREGVRGEVLEFGPSTTPGIAKIENRGLGGWEISWKGFLVRFPLPGSHNLLDALAALSVASALGTDPEATAEGLSTVKPLFGRSEILKGRISLLRDCYNANPDSVHAAIDFCDSVEWQGRKVFVLGSMLELGEGSAREHELMGRRAFESTASAIFFFGPDARAAYEAASALKAAKGGKKASAFVFHTDDIEVLKQKVAEYLRDGDLVLAKASRGLALERLTEDLSRRGFVPADQESREVGHAS